LTKAEEEDNQSDDSALVKNLKGIELSQSPKFKKEN
jgi:hypothetical protein